MHILEKAEHWVHVDDLEGLLELMVEAGGNEGGYCLMSLVSSINETNIFWQVFDLAPMEGYPADDNFIRILQWIWLSIPKDHR